MASSTKRSKGDRTVESVESDVSLFDYDTPEIGLQEYEYTLNRAPAPLTKVRDWQMAEPNHVCNYFRVPDSRLLH